MPENSKKRKNNKTSKTNGKSKAKKQHNVLKSFLIFISMIIVAVCVFVFAVKMLSPDFDFSVLIPEQVSSFVENLFAEKETTSEPEQSSSAPIAPETTTKRYNDYIEHEKFALDPTKKGCIMGNILNGGKVDKDGAYIYHIVDGKGIYRFYTANETFVCVLKTDETLSSLNIIGENIYYINENKKALFRLNKKTLISDPVINDVEKAVVYDNVAYCVNSSNQLISFDISSSDQVSVFTPSAEEDVRIIGVSEDCVFFSISGDDVTSYYVVDKKGHGDIKEFRPQADNDEIRLLSFEDGFMYYYLKQEDASYNIVRQKFGSEKVVTLVENVNSFKDVVVDGNRLFYSTFSGSVFKVKELNMNSGDKKVMLSVGKVSDENMLTFQHGGEYDFIIGKNGKKKVYSASSNLTSSTNVMKFSKGSWSY